MSDVLYRFRSTHSLLDGYNELENQEIYFASPEQLNDPMEGFKHIFWSGDIIVWNNLLRHYILCLEHCCLIFVLNGESTPLKTSDIPVFKTKDDLPTGQHLNLYEDICDIIFKNEYASQLAHNLATKTTPVSRDELIFRLRVFHQIAVETIFNIYESRKFITKRLTKTPPIPEKFTKVNMTDLLNQLEKEHPGNDTADRIFAYQRLFYAEMDVISYYNAESPSDKNNQVFIFSHFPEKYVQAIEKLVYPEWYTACFMAECNNSSIWGHYGDKHRGVCLIFNVEEKNNHKFIDLNCINGWSSTSGPTYGNVKHQFFEIDYIKHHTKIDFFKSLGRMPRQTLQRTWYKDGQGNMSICSDGVFNDEDNWRKSYWENYYLVSTKKLEDWKNEKEHRLLLSNMINDYSDPANRKLKYNFNSLKGIIFGINTDTNEKMKIIKIIENKCRKEKREDFLFYQAYFYYSQEGGSIDNFLMSFIKFTP